MKRAIIIQQEKLTGEILPILPLANYQAIAKTENGIDALRMVQRLEPDLVICGWNMQELGALDLIQNLVDGQVCPIILIMEPKDQNNVSISIKTNVHHIITTPLRAFDFITGIMLAEERYKKEIEHKEEVRRVREELKTRKIIYQAILRMIPLGFDEEAAYTLLRKKAMTTRSTLRNTALDFIKGKWLPHED